MSADLDEEADNNQPLEKTDQTMSTKADVIEELMEALLQDVIAHSAALGCEVMSAADTEAEASTDSVKTHMESNDTTNDHLLDVEEKSDAEPDWMFDYEPIKSWADFMEETEGTIDQSGEYNVEMALI
ncbi:hypothetical protein MHYP_G00309920 [Metynnis hypsauchen]